MMFILVGVVAALMGYNAVWLAMSMLIVLWCWQYKHVEIRWHRRNR